jgi:hypothetical protein
VPQSGSDFISTLAKVSGESKNLVFDDCNCIPFNWPDNDFPLLDPTPIGAYPGILAKMLGVLVDCSTRGVSHPVSPPVADFPVNNEPDWTTMADEAMQNNDLDMAAQLPPVPEIIELDDDDDDDDDFGPSLLPSTLRCTLQYIPKVEPNLAPPTISFALPSHSFPIPLPCYPSRTQAPPKHHDEYHLITTMADESLISDPSYPYINATGTQAILQFKMRLLWSMFVTTSCFTLRTNSTLLLPPPKNNMA